MKTNPTNRTISLIFIALLIIYFSLVQLSCNTEDTIYTNLSGNWDVEYNFTTINKKVNAEMELTQNNTSLSGKVDDGADVFTLLQSCCVNGDNVTIKYYVSGSLLKQTGTVNSDYSSMNGSFYAGGTYAGTWEADRSNKNAGIFIVGEDESISSLFKYFTD